MRKAQLFELVLLMFCSQLVLAQKPTIAIIVNSASYAAPVPNDTIAPGSIATIFGTNLASDTIAATSTPLPTQLAGTTVTVDGVPAPLFYVSPNQINFQVSWRYQPQGGHEVVVNGVVRVTSAIGSSDPYAFEITTYGPGIFTADGSGCGQGAILNVAADGSVTPNCPANSAAPGGTVTLFVLGVGATRTQPPPDGSPSPSDPPVAALIPAGVIIGGKRPTTLFSGLAPGLVGVFQINARLADDTPEGCAIPVVLVNVFDQSQIVSISAHAGGGQCVGSSGPPVNTGTLEWRRTAATGIDPPPPPELFTADFENVLMPSFLAPDAAPVDFDNSVLASFGSSCRCYDVAVPLVRQCPPFANVPLDARALTLRTPDGKTINVPRSQAVTGPQYQAVLPSNTINAGAFTVTGSGGTDVGPFASTLALPQYPPISITTNLSPGSVFPRTNSFNVNWTGGRAGETVHMRITTDNSPGGYCECTAPATSGGLTLPAIQYPSFLRIVHLPGPIQGPTEVRIFVESEGDQIQSFTAPGLTHGRHRWFYEWRFGKISF